MPGEFDLIRRHFARPAPNAVLGVGDDAALLSVTPGRLLAVTSDMLVAGRHFFAGTDPESIGHKTLAVNLSDLAAMGARPRWATLAVALPEADEAWLAAFARGFFALAERFGVELVGGDTTRGPLNLCVTLFGEVDPARVLRRDGARAGDDVWVSGQLGGAALALAHLRGELDLGAAAGACLHRLHCPEPRLALGRALAGLASAAIDISDGLLADLGHILEASGAGAVLDTGAIPHDPACAAFPDRIAACAWAGGDDYELCFTTPPACADAIMRAGRAAGVAVTRVGSIVAEPGIRDARGGVLPHTRGYDHFA